VSNRPSSAYAYQGLRTRLPNLSGAEKRRRPERPGHDLISQEAKCAYVAGAAAWKAAMRRGRSASKASLCGLALSPNKKGDEPRYLSRWVRHAPTLSAASGMMARRCLCPEAAGESPTPLPCLQCPVAPAPSATHWSSAKRPRWTKSESKRQLPAPPVESTDPRPRGPAIS
jgi:hypothetical protein